MQPQVYYFAAANYSCDAYGTNAYSTCSTSDAAASAGGQSGGGLLADTGYEVLVPLALAVAIAGAATILLIKRLVRRRKSDDGAV